MSAPRVSSLYADPGTYEQLDCGCEFWNQDGNFVMRPCSPSCQFYQYAVAETRRAGNQIRYKAE